MEERKKPMKRMEATRATKIKITRFAPDIIGHVTIYLNLLPHFKNSQILFIGMTCVSIIIEIITANTTKSITKAGLVANSDLVCILNTQNSPYRV